MEQFYKDLPELYIPVVNKLLFRFFYLWLNASQSEFTESLYARSKGMTHKSNVEMVFNKARLLMNG